MIGLSRELLDTLWPKADPALKNGMITTQADAFAIGEIDSQLRLIHFMAQASEECGGGTEMIENMNYSAERIHEVWPARFPTVEKALPFAHNQKALANRTYNGRLGNRLISDDGYTFRGRGLLQETGRDEYYSVGMVLGIDLLTNPDLAIDPQLALKVACASWKLANANGAADDDSLQRVTRTINGGLIGLQARQVWLGKWRRALG